VRTLFEAASVTITTKGPVEAQVFQVWRSVTYETKPGPHVDPAPFRMVAPDIGSIDRAEHKRRLCRDRAVSPRQEAPGRSAHRKGSAPTVRHPSHSGSANRLLPRIPGLFWGFAEWTGGVSGVGSSMRLLPASRLHKPFERPVAWFCAN
jgi:hypothetical protein